ncbi:MAG: hypothetical protein A2622_07865 [Bdellovibrionales bacterium RIFCSPHIGHO2_01_FULL_40_29]|nr:MAG: hypothetical protein A2622_07865 [Bdellovibrionales bacterium RIFCSPHIGHO2_01_FULL_40_29]OFZ33722.1 MAG: hypothetical protein A3D17_09955 [Bdellovibrionales bacterium RIFCSPHIGHO2_02_FULL_40_15]
MYMEQEDLKNYLNELTGISNLMKGFESVKVGKEKLPRLVHNHYDLKYVDVMNKKFVLAEVKGMDIEARKLTTHEEIIHKVFKRPVIFFFKSLGSYHAKYLTGHRINFVVARGAVFLPDVLLVMNHNKEESIQEVVRLTPWAMLFLIYQLNYRTLQNKTISDLAIVFKTTKMQASRVVEELKTTKLVDIIQKGTYKYVQFAEQKELWAKLRPYFQSPVIKKIYTDDNVGAGKLAGFTALDRFSMLHDSGVKTKAIYKKKFAEIERNKDIKTVPKEFARYCFEIWSWDPKALAKEDVIDPISLYLSMKDQSDERTQIALDTLLREIEIK